MELSMKQVKVTTVWGVSTESGIEISVLVNKVALKTGQELIVYREAAPVKARGVKRHMALQDGPVKKAGGFEKKYYW
jgi:hypothetical protein